MFVCILYFFFYDDKFYDEFLKFIIVLYDVIVKYCLVNIYIGIFFLLKNYLICYC